MNETLLASAHGIDRIDDAIARAVVAATARKHLVDADDVIGRSRIHHIVLARAEAAWRMWRETKMTLQEIGDVLGGRDHSTVSYLIASHGVRIARGEA